MVTAIPRFDYRTWQQGRLNVAGRSVLFATKPGVAAHGEIDVATSMLADAVAERVSAKRSHDAQASLFVVSLACGNGSVGAAAAVCGASRVEMTDRYLPNVNAALRTAQANGDIAERVGVVHAHGAAHLPDQCADIVTVRVVPERIPQLLLLRDARRLLKLGGVCLLAGGNDEGAKSAARVVERVFGHAKLEVQHSAHRLVSATALASMPDVVDDADSRFIDLDAFHQVRVSFDDTDYTLFSRPGVFSWEHLDEATIPLLASAIIPLGARVLDLGCGAGILGTVAARRSQTGNVVLIDADADAVRCAQRTIDVAKVTNARAMTSDVASSVLDERFDVVLANPPFHLGRDTNYELPLQFMRDAHAVLVTGGRLYLVANRTLPYEPLLDALFGNASTVHNGPRFKVLMAEKRAAS